MGEQSKGFNHSSCLPHALSRFGQCRAHNSHCSWPQNHQQSLHGETTANASGPDYFMNTSLTTGNAETKSQVILYFNIQRIIICSLPFSFLVAAGKLLILPCLLYTLQISGAAAFIRRVPVWAHVRRSYVTSVSISTHTCKSTEW